MVLSCLNNILGKAKLQGTESSSVVARAGHRGGDSYSGAARRNLGGGDGTVLYLDCGCGGTQLCVLVKTQNSK